MAASNTGPSGRGKNKNKPKTRVFKPGAFRPPAGSYDPILDAQRRAANRGFGDLELDIEEQREEGLADYTTQGGLLTRGRDRSLADILTGETRAGEDKTRALADLDLQYDRLATRQAEGARVAGVTSGGLLAKSAAVRDQNETRDQQPILASFNRAMQDFGTARGRVGEDYDTNRSLLDTNYGRTYGEFGDLTKQLTRAGRENTIFGSDIQAQKVYQAEQTGWKGPPVDKPGKYRWVPGKNGKPGKWVAVKQRPDAGPTGGVQAP